jgi:hypothetical protein
MGGPSGEAVGGDRRVAEAALVAGLSIALPVRLLGGLWEQARGWALRVHGLATLGRSGGGGVGRGVPS